MNTLLQLNTSMFSAGGQSSRLADRFVAAWRRQNPGAQIIVAQDEIERLVAPGSLALAA